MKPALAFYASVLALLLLLALAGGALAALACPVDLALRPVALVPVAAIAGRELSVRLCPHNQ